MDWVMEIIIYIHQLAEILFLLFIFLAFSSI